MNIIENGLYMTLSLKQGRPAGLLHFSCAQQDKEIKEEDQAVYTLAQLQASGFNQNDHHGSKHTGSSPSLLMSYTGHEDYRNEYGRKLEIRQEYEGLLLTTHLQFYDGIQVIRVINEVENHSEREYALEYLSSFCLTGLTENARGQRDENGLIYLPHNTWFGEAQWKKYMLKELGYDAVNSFSMKRIHIGNTGSWASDEYLPMGCYYNIETDRSLCWQIETSASWHWEVSDIRDNLYVQASGPSYQENGWLKKLKPGESFVSVPCAVSSAKGEFQETIVQLTQYRRRIRRKNEDNEKLPVIFNDYMNCLMGDPTTEVLKPLIDAAAQAGCEIFCVDCGWYSDGHWWDGVGEWMPSSKRFPGGIKEVMQSIRDKGMIPGLWLELEVMGINCPMVQRVSKDWFFQRNGEPIIDHCRYQLDYRNPGVREFADGVVRRLVEEYGVGYIKMDYNIDTGVGTDYQADSAGDGLLEHTRAYLNWLDDIFVKYPELIIENCSSGGMRMDYSMLSRQSIQSVTDQTDYIRMTAIAANCATACTPEQAAIWSYPLVEGTAEETIYNMVNAMLFRIHQSGYLGQIGKERMAYVTEGIACYKTIREDIKKGIPYWPVGLATMSDEYVAYSLLHEDRQYLAVWRTRGEGENGFCVFLDGPAGRVREVSCIYPKKPETVFDVQEQKLYVYLEPKSARLFLISREAE